MPELSLCGNLTNTTWRNKNVVDRTSAGQNFLVCLWSQCLKRLTWKLHTASIQVFEVRLELFVRHANPVAVIRRVMFSGKKSKLPQKVCSGRFSVFCDEFRCQMQLQKIETKRHKKYMFQLWLSWFPEFCSELEQQFKIFNSDWKSNRELVCVCVCVCVFPEMCNKTEGQSSCMDFFVLQNTKNRKTLFPILFIDSALWYVFGDTRQNPRLSWNNFRKNGPNLDQGHVWLYPRMAICLNCLKITLQPCEHECSNCR